MQNEHLILIPDRWRLVLQDELVKVGLEHDAAGVVAHRVIERLVCSYLGGSLTPPPTKTDVLDEAA